MPQLDIRSFVVISTAHVSEATPRCLETGHVEDRPWAGGPYGTYGWFLYAHDENRGAGADAIPDDLMAVMEWARSQGCHYLLLDRDGDTVDGLDIYEW
ncbi:MAG: hypothetical protein H6883_00010 [Rhodobiaceae bacterium]|nr:hypothetical protein [Rhodobiaceae bacterium]